MKIAVLGYGTIGSGVVEVIRTNAKSIAKRAGEEVEVKYVLDLRDFPEDPVQEILVHDYNVIAEDEEVRVIVETMGGTKPAYDFVKTALLNGKSVCSSNKELVAAHGAELIQIARDKKVNFFFEASVGGGIPIIRPLNQCITADEIQEINGILNGTTNFILTKMADEGADFDEVLKKAQELGYAEKDPTADVEGYDACRKIAILTSLAYGKQVDYEDIYTEGITKITAEDFKYAKKINSAIKIFGTSKKVGDQVYAMVAPQMIDSTHPLYSVNDVFNGISVTGNMLGDVMFYGAGAGKLPTASAVVADVVAAVKHQGENVSITWSAQKLEITPVDEMENRFFVRVGESEKEKISEVFGEVQMIEAGIAGECGFITGSLKEKEFAAKAESFATLITRIRVSA
ncbi:MAG: homoserine dehydrogenase [Eubacterium sp.]|nr:homoserine dehydrogenase [Eubacterium sp.]MCI9411161.1 homoserine dehydrogenase [Eubacterium sp.]